MSRVLEEADRDTILEAISKGRCIPFLGAGVSKEIGCPDGNQLREFLLQQINVQADDLSLYEVADLVKIRLGWENLLALLKAHLHPDPKIRLDDYRQAISLWHLARMNFPIITTANFDQTVEEVLSYAGYNPIAVARPNEVGYLADDSRSRVFKLHGDLRSGNPVILSSHLSNYPKDFSSFEAKWRSLLPEFQFLFLGYNLKGTGKDYDILQWINRIPEELGDNANWHYVIGPGRNPALAEIWDKRKIKFIPLTASEFLTEIARSGAKERPLPFWLNFCFEVFAKIMKGSVLKLRESHPAIRAYAWNLAYAMTSQGQSHSSEDFCLKILPSKRSLQDLVETEILLSEGNSYSFRDLELQYALAAVAITKLVTDGRDTYSAHELYSELIDRRTEPGFKEVLYYIAKAQLDLGSLDFVNFIIGKVNALEDELNRAEDEGKKLKDELKKLKSNLN